MKKLSIILFLPLMMFATACQNDSVIDEKVEQNTGVCKLKINANIESFDAPATRANGSSSWRNGDCVYLSFQQEGNKVKGRALYDESSNDWTLYYDGILTNGIYKGKAVHITEVSSNTTNVKFSHLNNVYADDEIVCEKTTEMMIVNATLRPQTGRVRFLGEPGNKFNLSGVWHYNVLNANDCSLCKDESTLNIKINNDGYSDYVYCSFPQLSRTLTISYDNYIYTTICEHPILDIAQSGYMELPTEAKHNGWNMTVLSLPTLSNVVSTSVEGEGTVTLTAQVLTTGNGTISECGFVYSVIDNPTVNDVKILCDDKQNLSTTINGLTVGERYYVRAYAINEVGIAYSEESSFIAGGGRPNDEDIDRPELVKKQMPKAKYLDEERSIIVSVHE